MLNLKGLSAGESEASVSYGTEVQMCSSENGVPIHSNERDSSFHRLGCHGCAGSTVDILWVLTVSLITLTKLDGLRSDSLDEPDEIKTK